MFSVLLRFPFITRPQYIHDYLHLPPALQYYLRKTMLKVLGRIFTRSDIARITFWCVYNGSSI
jgi:hypothetical protein